MRKITLKSLLVSASTFVALLMMNPTVDAQSATSGNSQNSVKSKDQKVNADVNKQGEVKSNSNTNSNTSISNKPTLSEREQEKAKRANQQNSNKPAMSEVEKEKMIRAGRLEADPKQKRSKEITIVDYPGYPKYIETGDADLDSRNYQKAKMKWIKENPKAYEEILNKDAKLKEEESRNHRKPQTK
jgi:hypothetical protein